MRIIRIIKSPLKHDNIKNSTDIITTMLINSCIELKHFEPINSSLSRINELYIILPVVLHCNGTDFCKDFTLMRIVEDNWRIPFIYFIGKYGI